MQLTPVVAEVDVGAVDGRDHPHVHFRLLELHQEELSELEVGRDPQVALAQHDEGRNLLNLIGI